MDIRNIDVAAASAAGIVVMRALGRLHRLGCRAGDRLYGRSWARDERIGHSLQGGAQARQDRMGVQLAGSTLGIIGCGTIGRRLAGLATALGMTVLAADPDDAAVPLGHRACGAEYAAAAIDLCRVSGGGNTADTTHDGCSRFCRDGA